MSDETENAGESFAGRLRNSWGRMAYGAVVAGLAVAFLMYRVGQRDAATWVMAATCGLLLTLPVINVVMVLVEEVRRRDWMFVALAVTVLALIAFTVATKI